MAKTEMGSTDLCPACRKAGKSPRLISWPLEQYPGCGHSSREYTEALKPFSAREGVHHAAACVSSCWYAKSPISECECFCCGENHGRRLGGAAIGGGFSPVTPENMPYGAVPGHYSSSSSGEEVYTPQGTQLDLRRSLRLANHSPTGFAWGYSGSGPAQLALAILLDAGVEPSIAVRHHQSFKSQVVAGETWGAPLKVPRSRVESWIRTHIGGVR